MIIVVEFSSKLREKLAKFFCIKGKLKKVNNNKKDSEASKKHPKMNSVINSSANSDFLRFESEPLQSKKALYPARRVSKGLGLALLCIVFFFLGRQTVGTSRPFINYHEKVKIHGTGNSDQELSELEKKAGNSFIVILEAADKQFKEDVKGKFKAAADAAGCEFSLLAADSAKIPITLRQYHYTFTGPVALFIAKQRLYQELKEDELTGLDEAGLKTLFEGYCAAV